jgi:hypothetical protein
LTNVDDEMRRAGLTARRLSAPEPVAAKPKRLWVTGRFAGVDGSSFAVHVEAASPEEAKAEAVRLLQSAQPIADSAGERVTHEPEDELPAIETIVDGRLQPER